MKKISQNKLYLYFSILVIIVAILAIILGTVFGIKSKNARTVSNVEITFHSKTGKEIAKRKFKLDEKISVSFSNEELELAKSDEFLGWSNIQNSKTYITELKAKKEYAKLYPVFKNNEENSLVSYKVVHLLEKQGKESSLDNTYERIEEIKTNQFVKDGAVYQDYTNLDIQLYKKTLLILTIN